MIECRKEYKQVQFANNEVVMRSNFSPALSTDRIAQRLNLMVTHLSY